MTIEECRYADVECFRRAAAKERRESLHGPVAISDTPTTRWFLARGDGGKVLGCAALTEMPKGVKIRGVYVVPGSRGIGLGTKLTDFLIDLAHAENRTINVFAWNPGFYLPRGFKIVGKNRDPRRAVRMRFEGRRA